MKKNKTLFQWIILGTFFIMAIFGFLLFAGYNSPEDKEQVRVGDVVIWGTMDSAIAGKMISNLKGENEVYEGVSYIEKEKTSYDMEILEALASGNSPDLILVSSENIYKNLNKIYPVPYTAVSKRDFLDTYADAFSIFLSNEGILATPFLIDPMVMYYNKEIFRSEGFPLPPKV
jgi:ABC-type glycerol-3-phosphate transport system substrate-binding protein